MAPSTEADQVAGAVTSSQHLGPSLGLDGLMLVAAGPRLEAAGLLAGSLAALGDAPDVVILPAVDPDRVRLIHRTFQVALMEGRVTQMPRLVVPWARGGREPVRQLWHQVTCCVTAEEVAAAAQRLAEERLPFQPEGAAAAAALFNLVRSAWMRPYQTVLLVV